MGSVKSGGSLCGGSAMSSVMSLKTHARRNGRITGRSCRMNGAYIRPVANGRGDELTALAQRIAGGLAGGGFAPAGVLTLGRPEARLSLVECSCATLDQARRTSRANRRGSHGARSATRPTRHDRATTRHGPTRAERAEHRPGELVARCRRRRARPAISRLARRDCCARLVACAREGRAYCPGHGERTQRQRHCDPGG
jgi:hypothetical protein